VTRALVFALCVSMCTALFTSSWAQRAGGASVGGSFSQPLRDLSIVRDEPPDVLRHAAAAPYALPGTLSAGDSDCAMLGSEIASLDAALGPDVDVPNDHRMTAASLFSSAISGVIGGVIGLPYRGIIRRLSGAEHRDQVLQAATQAGMVRRAFLKGLRVRDCATLQSAPAASMLLANSELSPPQIVPPMSEPEPLLTTVVSEPLTPQQIATVPAPVAPRTVAAAEPAPSQSAVPESTSTQTGAVLQPVSDMQPVTRQ
jgi:hypothetical protein